MYSREEINNLFAHYYLIKTDPLSIDLEKLWDYTNAIPYQILDIEDLL